MTSIIKLKLDGIKSGICIGREKEREREDQLLSRFTLVF